MPERAGFWSSQEDPLATLSQPLAGKRIVVTRAPELAGELIRALEQIGAEILILPTVSFAPPSDWQPLDSELRVIAEFDWILFTSQNAVRFLAQRCRELKFDVKSLEPRKPSIAAVGPVTAQAASEAGFRVDYIAKEHSGEGLARELQSSLRSRRVLLPRSDRVDDRLPNLLREAGARVTEVVAYRTAAPKTLDSGIADQIRRAEVNAIVFASPSAYRNLSDLLGAKQMADLSSRVDFATIGPTTARALRDGGARVAIEANESSAAGLADAIAKHYQRQISAKDSGAKSAVTSRRQHGL
jgi:uroporphyrinogen III methyltransferase/synthase